MVSKDRLSKMEALYRSVPLMLRKQEATTEGVLKNIAKENTCVRVSFFIKLQADAEE